MRKKIFTIIAVAVLAVSCITLAACDNTTMKYPVSIAQAKEIAMTHTGVVSQEIEAPTVLVEGKGDGAYYVVEFKIEGVTYTYRINTQTGDIEKIAVNGQPVDNVDNAPEVPAKNQHESYIGYDEAKRLALEAVGLTEEAVQGYIEVELDFDHGKYLYEVEFRANGVEYEIELVAETGELFKVNKDHETTVEPEGTNYIGVERAKEIALTTAGLVGEQVIFDGVELEKHRGTHIYEVEFDYQGVEYEFKINATTGEIITKTQNGQGPTLNEDGLIGLERAKEIALASAGVDAHTAIFDAEDTKLESERGKYVYEVSFTAGDYEYEYEIDALTGEILEIDKELKD